MIHNELVFFAFSCGRAIREVGLEGIEKTNKYRLLG
jgi:hypothetical protein